MRDLDRAVLRNVVLVAMASTASLVIVGTTCLGRNMARLDTASGLDRDASRASGGGVPVGTAAIASATVGRAPPRPPPAASTERPPEAPMTAGSFNMPSGPPPGLRTMPGQLPMPTPLMTSLLPPPGSERPASPSVPPAQPYPSASPSPGIVVHPTASSAPTFAPPPGFVPPPGHAPPSGAEPPR